MQKREFEELKRCFECGLSHYNVKNNYQHNIDKVAKDYPPTWLFGIFL